MGTIVRLTKDEVIAIAIHIMIIENSFKFIRGYSGLIKAIMTDKRKIIALSIGNSTSVLVVAKNITNTKEKLRIPVYILL